MSPGCGTDPLRSARPRSTPSHLQEVTRVASAFSSFNGLEIFFLTYNFV